jgi:micrococcal nuclease
MLLSARRSRNCGQERELAKKATDRLKQLLQGRIGLDIRGVDQFGRLFARVKLSDGREAGEVLISEHLARPYQEGERSSWC